MFKRVVITSLIVLTAGALFTGYFYHVGKLVKEHRGTNRCSSIEVVILDSLDNSLITPADVQRRITPWIGDTPLDSIDIHSIEMMINAYGEVAHAEVFRKDYENLRVELTQRTPVVRFISDGNSYYADADGYVFPVYKHTDVPVVTGAIPMTKGDGFKGYLTEEEHNWIMGATHLASHITANPYWKRTIMQIDAQQDGEFVIYSNACRQKILFGSATNIDTKFKKLEAYFKNIVPLKGEDHYSTIVLKYDNQIICK